MSQREGESSGTPFQHMVVAIIAIVAVVHSVIIAVWLAPSSPLRSESTARAVARYVDPYFGQSWDTLDPSSQRVDEKLRIRATIREKGQKATVTPWVDVTATDLAAVRSNVFAPRARLIGRRLATNLNARYLALDSASREVVDKDFVDDIDSATQLRIALRTAGASSAEIVRYVNTDRMTVRFASLYAIARWGSGVQEVQYASGYRQAPSRGARETSIDDVPFSEASFGWRRVVRPEAAAQKSFDAYVKPAPAGEGS